jgi:MoxR-like ATPase
LAGGHLLIDDVPGVGKTTLAHALSRTFGLQFSRVQFTSDLMPSDLSGVSVYERAKEAFVFHPGPLFAQVLLADEINRASPKTQSALLEAMEEKQVTIEGETRALPRPFFVIATQNPLDQLGTYALPESQLDRFLMRISLGYPDRAAERALLAGSDRRNMVDHLPSLLAGDELATLQQAVMAVHTADPLLDYVQDLITATRSGRWFLQGLSPRAGIALLRAAKAQALLSGRDYVAPDDVQAVLPQTVAHRMVPVGDAGRGAEEQVRAMMQAVPLP